MHNQIITTWYTLNSVAIRRMHKMFMNKQFNNVKFTHSRQMCARWTKKKNNKNTQIRIHKISTQKIRNNCIKWRWWSRVRVTPTFKLYANEKWALNKTECFSVFFSRLVISLLLFPFYPHWMLWAVFCCFFFYFSSMFFECAPFKILLYKMVRTAFLQNITCKFSD